jgi:uncharacterized protein
MRAAPRLGLLIAAGFGLLSLVAGAFEIRARATPSLYDPPVQYLPPGEVEAARGMREVRAVTSDGLSLRGWYAPATARPYTLLFFHGSGDGLAKAARMTTPFVRSGYGVLLAEFRGYSGEPGTPSEQGLYQDGRAFVRALQSLGVEPKQVVLFGYSVGTGVAVKLATEYPVAGLMLLAPFLSINKITQHEHPWLPVDLLVKDSYDNASRMPNVHCPVLIGHGTADKVVPVRQGKALFDLANQPKALTLLDGDGHLNAFDDFAKVAIPWLGKLPPSP